MSRKLRTAVIGLRMGLSHVYRYQNNSRCECVAICDLNQELLESVGNERGIEKRYDDYREMLEREELDLVSVAVPNKLHSSISIDVMQSGCHVLCEKPMAKTLDEAEKMKAVSLETEKKLMIHFSHRAAKPHPYVKEMVDQGDFGEIYFIRTVWHRRDGVPWWYPLSHDMCGGGPVIDLGVHMLDRAMWLAGFPEPQWVLATTKAALAPQHHQAKKRNINYDMEDFGAAMIKMSNGMMLELEASWACHHSEPETRMTQIYGTKAGALIHKSGELTLFTQVADRAVDSQFPDVNYFLDSLVNLSPNLLSRVLLTRFLTVPHNRVCYVMQ